jgi:hypothetical protein
VARKKIMTDKSPKAVAFDETMMRFDNRLAVLTKAVDMV